MIYFSEKLSETLLHLKSAGLESFFSFIEKRYFPERIISNASISEVYALDKKALGEILERISEDAENAPRIRKFNLGRHAKLLAAAIQKLEGLEHKEVVN